MKKKWKKIFFFFFLFFLLCGKKYMQTRRWVAHSEFSHSFRQVGVQIFARTFLSDELANFCAMITSLTIVWISLRYKIFPRMFILLSCIIFEKGRKKKKFFFFFFSFFFFFFFIFGKVSTLSIQWKTST